MHEVRAADLKERLGRLDWSALGRRLKGCLVHEGNEDMMLAGKHFSAGQSLAFPQVLIRCANQDDVCMALAFIRDYDVPFAIRSGGHCFADFSSHAGAVVDLSPMNCIEVDGDRMRVGPGAHAADVVRALAAKGRMVPTGGCPWVAMGGLSLVGGFGFLGRRFGLTTDQVERMRVISADGDVLEASSDCASDLFWALRGAGAAGFGVVAGITLRTQPLSDLTVCHGAWSLREAAGLIERWQQWMPATSGEINLELGLVGPDDPDLDSRVELYGVVLGDAAAARPPLTELRRWLGSLVSGLRTWSLSGERVADYLVGLLDRCTEPAWQPSRPYRQIGYQFTRSDFFDGLLNIEAIKECVERFQADRRYAQVRELEFVPWGGAYANENAGACFLHRHARLLIRHTAMLGSRATLELRGHAQRWVDASRHAVCRHANGHVYQGYADLRLENWAHSYYGAAFPRLREVKRRYDPGNFFRHAQSIDCS